MAHHADQTLPALLGGVPVRPSGPPDWPPVDPAVDEILQQLARDRSWGRYHGPYCKQLSESLAELHQAEHVILCSSGTVAIELALRGLQVGDHSGDEAILAAYDFKGNFQDVLAVGGTPVLVDVDPRTWQLNANLLETAATDRTRALIVSHLHGAFAPIREAMQFAAGRGIGVIEDACQTPGAMIDGRRAGMWGDVGVLSFGGSKLLTAGRGGAILTSRGDIAQRIRLCMQRGNDAYPLSEMQAAVLLPQLRQLDERNNRRAQQARRLIRLLSSERGLQPLSAAADDPPHSAGRLPGYYKLGFQYDPAAFAELPRDRFAQAMRAEGIALDAGFRGLHAIHSPRRFRAAGPLTEADRADRQILTLHHPVLLEEEASLQEIAAAVDKIRRYATMLRDDGAANRG